MQLNADVRRLIAILEDEGFGGIAGELMAEINLGRSDERKSDDQVDASGEIPDTRIVYVPLADEEQMQFSIEWLRLRLVEPVRCFVEAELIATELNEGRDVRIYFIDSEYIDDNVPLNKGNVGDYSIIEGLDRIFVDILEGDISPRNRGI